MAPRTRAAAGRPRLRPAYRIGVGIDVHPFAPGRTLVLGGVSIANHRGLAGHSDADVLAHAVCDAILGALALPDLGSRFKDDDPRHAGRSSLEFLEEAAAEARRHGYTIVNIDAVVLAEAPRLQPHLLAMRERLGAALGCPDGAIGVKAKHCEGLGAIGRQEGVMAQAVALLGRTTIPGGGRRRPGGVAGRLAKRRASGGGR
jgi:2-C-methyl-D-erythritol 2,4-cyclodiphosphate synthase